ncbi:hypothetical protein LIA77_07187 [Sarocladium implicatum]|jgi:hypothetical protein|nr:hypothetical protein LIA77_07187 [Sarocladium implicatum]
MKPSFSFPSSIFSLRTSLAYILFAYRRAFVAHWPMSLPRIGRMSESPSTDLISRGENGECPIASETSPQLFETSTTLSTYPRLTRSDNHVPPTWGKMSFITWTQVLIADHGEHPPRPPEPGCIPLGKGPCVSSTSHS